MMKKINKLLAVALSILMIIAFIPVEEALATEEIVYYENSFDNGIDDLVNSSNDYGSFVSSKEGRIGTVAIGGNNGVGVTNRAGWMGKDNYFTFNTSIDSGILSISVDLARTGDTTELTNIYDTSLFVNQPWQTKTNIFLLKKDHNLSVLSKSITTELNKVYSLNAVFDLDNDILYAYVDGELIDQKDLTAGFKVDNAGLSITDLTGYADNLKISRMTNASFTVSSAEISEDFTYADVTFSERPKAVTVDDVTVKNSQGEEIAVSSAELIAGNKARLNFASELAEDDYTITFGGSVVSFIGSSLTDKDIVLEAYTNKVIISGRHVFAIVKNNTDVAISPVLVIGAYDNWTLKAVTPVYNVVANKATVESLEVGESGKMFFTMGSDFTDEIRAFLWYDLENITPIAPKAEVIY